MIPSLLAMFGAGVLTVLSPCVLPVAPILVGGLVVGKDASRWSRLRATLWFGLGFSVVFTAIGLGLSGAMAIAPLRAAFLTTAAVMLALYGVKMMGLVQTSPRFSWMDRTVTAPATRRLRPGMTRPMLLGALFALTWTPCAGPLLGGVLTYIASRPASVVPGASLLLTYGAGVATPLALVAIASEYVTPLLRRLTPRLLAIERATGAGLLALAGFLAIQIRMPAAASPGTPVTPPEAHRAGAGQPGVRRLVFFHSEHCPACRAMAAFLPDVERACGAGRWTLVPIDVDRQENAETVARFDVRAVPTTSLVDERGHESLRLVGFQPRARLREALAHEAESACADDEPSAEAPVDRMPACEVGHAC